MGPSETMDMVVGMLDRNEIEFQRRPDGDEVRVLLGTAAVFIGTGVWDGQEIVVIHSPLVLDLQLTPETTASAHFWVNQRNRETRFARFVLVDTRPDEPGATTTAFINAEHELLSADLQASELINAVEEMAAIADAVDEEAVALLGGKTYAAASEEEAEIEQE